MAASFPPRFTRTVDLYGPAGFGRLRRGGATVVGLGGVGAHCVVALARSGIGRLKLIDFDRITTSSLNRHPIAGPADVGRPKTEILAAWIARMCPDTRVEGVVARVEPDTVADLVPSGERELFPVLVDCIDSVAAKVALLAHGVEIGYRVLSSLGAAGKRDPGCLRCGDIFESEVCPLARKVRQGLREIGVGPGQVSAVWSVEPPVGPVAGTPDSASPDEAPGTRRQPSNLMLPGIFGFALAAAAADLLAGE
ncbi:MAG TPA: ThiF family adenylyltransferase [Candidatus Krumholzibacteria bacterium]|nr:ThiF family adenylyltransferase [Candidatus Krumholzibacteria bacterium]HPD70732.1 ThiF family adenylyltransferase [Candidatus Krumholzibacteria bacterium]HRY39568.1 ThiF family adenylyltransferase [Candidatus Krumholzibacteria bacterium]